jgi:hypothetical protein
MAGLDFAPRNVKDSYYKFASTSIAKNFTMQDWFIKETIRLELDNMGGVAKAHRVKHR